MLFTLLWFREACFGLLKTIFFPSRLLSFFLPNRSFWSISCGCCGGIGFWWMTWSFFGFWLFYIIFWKLVNTISVLQIFLLLFSEILKGLHRVSLSDNPTLCGVPCGANVTESEPRGWGDEDNRGMMRLPSWNHPGEKIFFLPLIVWTRDEHSHVMGVVMVNGWLLLFSN